MPQADRREADQVGRITVASGIDAGTLSESGMGCYRDRVLPRIIDVLMNTKETRRIRQVVCEPLHGDVLEVGFGTGHNLPFMPGAVDRVLAVDPLHRGRALAAERIEAFGRPVEHVGLDGQLLPVDDASVDCVLSTWTLCSIPDPVIAVQELRRVLKPGGSLHFVEHGLAPETGVQRWQHRCNGIQQRVAGGCNLNRDIPAVIRDGGMQVHDLETFYAKGDPKPLGWTFLGRAAA